MKILISSNSYKIREQSVNINDAFGERSTASFVLTTNAVDNISFSKGEVIQIKDELGVTIFKGVVDVIKEKKIENKRVHSIVGVDFHYLVEKRVVAKSYEEMLTGDIVKDIVGNILSEEGITYTAESIQTGDFIKQIQFNYVYCDDALDKLAEKSGCIWYVDINKVLWFEDVTVKVTQNTVDNSMIKHDSLIIENKNQAYRNRQYIKGAKQTTDLQTMEFKGDGDNRQFTLPFPLAKKPTLYVNDVQVSFSDVVLKGYNDTAQFFYAKNDSIIAHNDSLTALTASDTLKVEYNGQFSIIAITEDVGEVEKRKLIEGNSGKVENVASEPQLDNLDSVFQSATAKLRAYAKDTINIKFKTTETWFKAGMVVGINTEEITETDLLVQKVSTQDECNLLWSTVTLVKGAVNASWAKVFAKALTIDNTAVQEEMLQNETLVLLETCSKTWLESENPNIMKTTYPSNTLFPSNDLYPMFLVSDRIKYIEVFDDLDNLMIRKYVTYTAETGNQHITNFYISGHECNGQWGKLKFYGGVTATESNGSGTLMDTVVTNRVKTQLENVQVKRTDTKGW